MSNRRSEESNHAAPANAVLTPQTPACTVLLADTIRSRRMERTRRHDLQVEMRRMAEVVSAELAADLLSRVEIREGDSLRAVFRNPVGLIRLLWEIGTNKTGARFRLGIGHGALDVYHAFPDDVDGPAYYNARDALDQTRTGAAVAFRGFPPPMDDGLTGLACLLFDRYEHLSAPQREAVSYLRRQLSKSDAAAELGITPASMTDRIRAARWESIRVGEVALRAMLQGYDTSAEWARS